MIGYDDKTICQGKIQSNSVCLAVFRCVRTYLAAVNIEKKKKIPISIIMLMPLLHIWCGNEMPTWTLLHFVRLVVNKRKMMRKWNTCIDIFAIANESLGVRVRFGIFFSHFMQFFLFPLILLRSITRCLYLPIAFDYLFCVLCFTYSLAPWPRCSPKQIMSSYWFSFSPNKTNFPLCNAYAAKMYKNPRAITIIIDNIALWPHYNESSYSNWIHSICLWTKCLA